MPKVGSKRKVKRIAVITVFLFVGLQILGQTLMEHWKMHPAYKNLPAWVVDSVWRPLVWKGNDEK